MKDTNAEWFKKQLANKPHDLLLNQKVVVSRLIEQSDKSIHRQAIDLADQEDGTKSIGSYEGRKKRSKEAKSSSPRDKKSIQG